MKRKVKTSYDPKWKQAKNGDPSVLTGGNLKAIKRYWRGIMRDKTASVQRRDKAAAMLFRIVSMVRKDKAIRLRRRVMLEKKRLQLKLANTRKIRRHGLDSVPEGKKAERKVKASELAAKSDWAGLIPSAQVLPFKKGKTG